MGGVYSNIFLLFDCYIRQCVQEEESFDIKLSNFSLCINFSNLFRVYKGNNFEMAQVAIEGRNAS